MNQAPLYILYVILFVIALKKSELAIAILVFLQCTVRLSALVIELGTLGSFWPSDFIIFGLIVNLLHRKRDIDTHYTLALKLIISWLFICSIYLFCQKEFDIKFIYNFWFRYVFLWIIPFFIVEYNEAQKTLIMRSFLFCIMFVLAFQTYAYATYDFAFIQEYYYEFAATGVHEMLDGADEILKYNQNNGLLPRLYPAGTTLCLGMLAYVLTALLFTPKTPRFSRITHYVFLGLLVFFLLSLRGRAPIFGLLFICGYSLFLFLFRLSKSKLSRTIKLVWLSLLLLGVLFIFISLFGEIINIPFLDQLIERLKAFEVLYYFDDTKSARASDNLISLSMIYENSLLGTGRPSVPMSQIGFGFDVHPLLSVALISGVPYLALIIYFSLLYLNKILGKNCVSLYSKAIPFGVALIYMLSLAILNSIQIFSNGMALIPFLVFSAFYNSEIINYEHDQVAR